MLPVIQDCPPPGTGNTVVFLTCGSELIARRSLLSAAYMTQARPSCLLLFMQEAATALVLARFNAGNSMAARMAMMAMTTSSSISVNPARRDFILEAVFKFI